MGNVSILPGESIGYNFIPPEYLPAGDDEYSLRNQQLGKPENTWRHLQAREVELLVKNGNTSDKWENILVANPFDPGQIENTDFFGFVRIGRMKSSVLEHHDLQLPTGITNSRIVSCDIGDDAAIHNVRYLAHFIIGDLCILSNIDEMHTTNHAKFGNGIIKDGEDENVRLWLDLMNETGSRRVMPFDGMIPADAYLWAKYRDDVKLQEKLKEITQNTFDSRRGFYGMVGDQCVVKSCRIIKDVKIGSHAYIKGANKLKNLTINSDEKESTQIGEGVELVNGIIGYGCHIFYGCKAVRFVLGNCSNLKYGARLINSFLGDNSTISCCEVLNNLIFPAHEQHHNNSFLIASVVKGQSNMAAGVTVGSNHNSRANDNEIQAGRGFWPGLCTSVKHSCRFASFVLLAKADYPAELDILLPFSLLNNNLSKDQLEVAPAFWWNYNMYALARNTWKFQNRDKRKRDVQKIEFDALAPDTAEELLYARRLLEIWTAKAGLRKNGETLEGRKDDELVSIGREILSNKELTGELEVLGENMEKSKRKVVILKPYEGYHAYGDMLHYYAVKNLIEYMRANDATFSNAADALKGEFSRDWDNLGGQLVPTKDVEQLRNDIGQSILSQWRDIHDRYDRLWRAYPLEKQRHAYKTICLLLETDELTNAQWRSAIDKAVSIQEYICEQVYQSRKKDFDNPFRQATYRNEQEMSAAIGNIEGNSFVKLVREETEAFKNTADEIKKRN
ncbi:MAG: DUF4954 domain-containing protein [Planctomycetota bacterium]|nr:MAG: DUF4954 domain-containing protein [Planctomycetota bacterium]